MGDRTQWRIQDPGGANPKGGRRQPIIWPIFPENITTRPPRQQESVRRDNSKQNQPSKYIYSIIILY